MGRWARRLGAQAAPQGEYSGALQDFSSEEVGTLVAVVGSSLTKLKLGLRRGAFLFCFLHAMC